VTSLLVSFCFEWSGFVFGLSSSGRSYYGNAPVYPTLLVSKNLIRRSLQLFVYSFDYATGECKMRTSIFVDGEHHELWQRASLCIEVMPF
jgi:hypothetical protein